MMRIALLIVLAGMSIPAGAAPQKQNVPKKPDVQALADENVKQILLLMDTDKNGKISKQEWMAFMGKEFDRLDKDKSGELDKKELMESTFSVRQTKYSDLGK